MSDAQSMAGGSRALTHSPAQPAPSPVESAEYWQGRPFEEHDPAQALAASWGLSAGANAGSPPLPPAAPPFRGHSFSNVSIYPGEPLPVQTQLTIGQPNDPYEQEADRVADQVMRMADPPPTAQRQDIEEDGGPDIRRSPDQAQPTAPQPDLENRLNASRSGGSPLPNEVRQFMEPRFGFDFSKVKVHNDADAVQMNRELGAQAFAHGNHIYYGAGKAPANDMLTGHELTHVVQQTGGLCPKVLPGQSNLVKQLPGLVEGNIIAKRSALPQPTGITIEPARTFEKALGNGQIQRICSIPFTQVIARTVLQTAKGDSETEQQSQEESIFVDEIQSPEELKAFNLDSSISSTLTHVPTVSQGGAAPSGFGETRSTLRFENVSISSSVGTIFGGGIYTVTGDLVHEITWQVRSGTGPIGQIDIQDENDPDIKACNYQLVAKDLTPNMGDLNGRPPRDHYWAEDLTIRHELFHAQNQDERTIGPQCNIAAQTWLNGQTASSATQIRDRLLRSALNEAIRVFNTLSAAPSIEGDAYADGAPLYQARADAISTKGDADNYGKVSTLVKVHPFGDEDYEVVRGDSLWRIAERTYGHGRYWREIDAANPGKSRDNGNLIFPGTVLRLPPINISKSLSALLIFDTNAVFTETALVPGGGSHEFLTSPKDLFTDTTNCSGNIDVDIFNDAGNSFLTTTWSLPNTFNHRNGSYEVTLDIK